MGLLQIGIVHEIYTNIVCEILKEGKLEKKGHVVHNWKMRWFVLTASSLNYHESHESMILKVTVLEYVLLCTGYTLPYYLLCMARV